MKLHELKTIKGREHRRVGRGGKRGTTAGRGTKGQHSRSGRRIRPAERDLIIRLPKLRGFRNKIKSDKVVTFNVGEIAAKFKALATKGAVEISNDAFKAMKMVSKNFNGQIKILGKGEIEFPVSLNRITVSESAKAKIEKAGGKVA